MHGAHAAALPEMRMLERFGYRQDRRMWHAILFEPRQRGLVTRHRLEPAFDNRDQVLEIDQPIGMVGETRILDEFRLAHRLAQAGEMLRQRRYDDYVALLCF